MNWKFQFNHSISSLFSFIEIHIEHRKFWFISCMLDYRKCLGMEGEAVQIELVMFINFRRGVFKVVLSYVV